MSRRLGILVTHPIQYYVPWFRHLSDQLDIQVFYAHRQSAPEQARAGFGVEFDWDISLLTGYPYRWLTNVARQPSVSVFAGCDTPEIYEIVRNERFDAFLIFGWNRKTYLQAIRACWYNDVPVLMRGDSQLETPRSHLKRLVKYLPYRWFLPRLNAHLYVGQRNKAYLDHYGVSDDRLFFAPHFVDNSFFATHAKRAVTARKHLAVRSELGIPHEAYVVLFSGKFIPEKRPADLIRACLRILKNRGGSDLHVIFVGDGPLATDLRPLAKPQCRHFHFAGFRNQTALPAIYATADVLVLPGYETWGLVVNEAMACGVPAIVSDASGCAPDLIEEGRTGYTYPVGNAASLASRILQLKRLQERQASQICDALARKMKCYSIGRATEGLAEALSSVTKQ